jgi:hypothetical protein
MLATIQFRTFCILLYCVECKNKTITLPVVLYGYISLKLWEEQTNMFGNSAKDNIWTEEIWNNGQSYSCAKLIKQYAMKM